MISDIDLTENRDFPNEQFTSNGLHLFRTKSLSFLKDTIYSLKDIIDKDVLMKDEYGDFFTGNKEERAKKAYRYAYMHNTVCDRCGETLNVFPWEEQKSLLCKKCEEELEEESDIHRVTIFPWNRNL